VQTNSIEDATAFRLADFELEVGHDAKGRVVFDIKVAGREEEAAELMAKCRRGHRGIGVDLGKYRAVRAGVKELIASSTTGGVHSGR
jgi:hypothetical protein